MFSFLCACVCGTLQELCAGFEVLEETLVLRLEGGAEHYIEVSARYASPSFGCPLEKLSAKHGSEVGVVGVVRDVCVFSGECGGVIVPRFFFFPRRFINFPAHKSS